jgi:hypothetical protein
MKSEHEVVVSRLFVSDRGVEHRVVFLHLFDRSYGGSRMWSWIAMMGGMSLMTETSRMKVKLVHWMSV